MPPKQTSNEDTPENMEDVAANRDVSPPVNPTVVAASVVPHSIPENPEMESPKPNGTIVHARSLTDRSHAGDGLTTEHLSQNSHQLKLSDLIQQRQLSDAGAEKSVNASVSPHSQTGFPEAFAIFDNAKPSTSHSTSLMSPDPQPPQVSPSPSSLLIPSPIGTVTHPLSGSDREASNAVSALFKPHSFHGTIDKHVRLPCNVQEGDKGLVLEAASLLPELISPANHSSTIEASTTVLQSRTLPQSTQDLYVSAQTSSTVENGFVDAIILRDVLKTFWVPFLNCDVLNYSPATFIPICCVKAQPVDRWHTFADFLENLAADTQQT